MTLILGGLTVAGLFVCIAILALAFHQMVEKIEEGGARERALIAQQYIESLGERYRTASDELNR